MKGERKGPGHFQVYQTSKKAAEILAEHEQACFDVAHSEGHEYEANVTKHGKTKLAIVEYIELLESMVGITPTVAFRF